MYQLVVSGPVAIRVAIFRPSVLIDNRRRRVYLFRRVCVGGARMALNGHSLNGSSRAMLSALKAAVRHAIQTMAALPDSDDPRRFQVRAMWVGVPDDPGLAYAYNETRPPRIVPSPKDVTRAEIVNSWLVWLRAEEGKRSLGRIVAWAKGAPKWQLAQRENCSERTIVNRIDRSMAAILREFLDEEATVDKIEEPAAMAVRHYHSAFEATTGGAGVRQDFGKVWIAGIGFMRDGRRLRDGREKVDDKRVYRDRPG